MYSMNYIGKFISNFRDFYNEINAATLTGAIDVVVVQQPDGSFTCSPFHVRFGKLGVLRSREKVVDIEINSEPRQIHMKLGDSGEAFFVEEVQGSDGFPIDSEIPPHLACSPIPNDDECFPNNRRFNVLSDLPQEQHEKILRDSVMSIEREKWEQMSALPPDERQNFLIEHFSDLPLEQREKWLQIASLTSEERDKIFHEYYGTISTIQKQQMISEQYSALKTEDKEKLFKENFPELPPDQRQRFEEALLTDWKKKSMSHSPKKNNREETVDDEEEEAEEEDDDDEDDKDKLLLFNDEEDIFNIDNINQEENPKENSTSNLKSFIAITSTERIRKISVVKNDFRPIVENLHDYQYESKDNLNHESTNAHLPLSTSSSSSSTKKSSKDESINDEIKSGNSKRKRKRKSVMKRKNAQRKISANTNNGADSGSIVTQGKIGQLISANQKTNVDDSESNLETVDESKNYSKNDQLDIISASHASIDFHFFSDTEVTTKNKDSRPNSPIQSDTEFEVQKITQESKVEEDEKSHGQSWKWGELPSPPRDSSLDARGMSLNSSNASNSNIETAEARRSMLGGMFSFMKKTSRVRHNPESEGIYLSDLNADELDPEVAALYFPSSHRSSGGNMTKEKAGDEEDAESGNGPSLPQSPNSVEGAIGGPKSLDSDFDESSKHFEPSLDIAYSLCGSLYSSEPELTEDAFQRNCISYNDVCADPKIFENPDLVAKINGKLYNWPTACAIVMTYTAYHRHLPRNAMSTLDDDKKRLDDAKLVEGRPSTESTGNGGGYSSWFSWRRSSQPAKKLPKSDFDKVADDDNSAVTAVEISNTKTVNSTKEEAIGYKMTIITGDDNNKDTLNDERISEMTNSMESLGTSQSIVSFTDAMEDKSESGMQSLPKEMDREGYFAGNEDSDEDHRQNGAIDILFANTNTLSATSIATTLPKRLHEGIQNFRKTLRLSSEQIASLNLKEGVNEVVFSVTTAYQGTTRCKCFIYKWRWDDKIVISDIDGTITKSDVLGHILPIVGKDWAQSGVAQLFTKIKNNGYKLLYLSARAIGQARVTREYLKSIKQGDLSLPDGPLLLNPTSLISAFHREVIEKKPEEFKISCLSDIKALFPDGSQPFYAGYGNRINDVWAYRAVGIPTTRIFTINHRGELKHELTQTFQSSYSNMSFIVDHLFPALREDAADEFSNFSYWREPIQELQKVEMLTTQN